MDRSCEIFMFFTLQRNNVSESLQTKFSSFKHQNCLGRLSTMGIPRPSPNILIQKVGVGWGGVGPWEQNCK